MSWLFATVGNDGEDYAGVVLLFCGGRLRVPLILYGCPFNNCARAHDAAFDSINWAAGETSDAADTAFKACCLTEASRIAADNPSFLRHLQWLATALYRVAHEWGQMRARLQKLHLNWK